jgi:hypothetical protein
MSIVDVDVAKEPLAAAEETIYTAPSASNFLSAKIVGGLCANPSTVDTELTVNIVQFGESASTTNQYFPPKVIFSGQYDLLSPIAGSGVTLKSGDYIVTKAGTASNINVKLSIIEKYSD